MIGFALLNQTMNGPLVCMEGIPTSTIANVLTVSKRNVIEVAHHSRDTECYFQLLNVVTFQSALRTVTVPVSILTNSWQT